MRRVALILVGILVSAGTVMGAVFGPASSSGNTKACARDGLVSFADLRDVEYFACVDRLLNERFPFRDALRSATAWVDYYLFQSSPVPEVHVGRDRWLNYYHELRDYRKSACSQREEVRDLARKLHELEGVVEASGRQFVFLVAPNKSTIYPEYVGLSRPLDCGKSVYDLLLEAFEEYPVSGFVRVDALLREAKTRHQVYFEMDTHWNDIGAWLVARAILRRFPSTPWAVLVGEGVVGADQRVGDLARMMGLRVSEQIPKIQIETARVYKSEQPPEPPLNIRHTRLTLDVMPDEKVLPRAIFYRDSFMNTLFKFLQGAFVQIDAYWTEGGPIRLPMEGSESVLTDSSIVLIEVVERNLPVLNIDIEGFRRTLSRVSGDLRYAAAKSAVGEQGSTLRTE